MVDNLFSDDETSEEQLESRDVEQGSSLQKVSDDAKSSKASPVQGRLNSSSTTVSRDPVDREEKINGVLARCMDVMDAAQQQMRSFEALQTEVFGSIDEADDFNDSVERRIDEDAGFKAQYEMMKAGHQSVIDTLSEDRFETPRRKPVQPSQTRKPAASYVPGNPVNAPPTSETSRKNHILRKKMI